MIPLLPLLLLSFTALFLVLSLFCGRVKKSATLRGIISTIIVGIIFFLAFQGYRIILCLNSSNNAIRAENWKALLHRELSTVSLLSKCKLDEIKNILVDFDKSAVLLFSYDDELYVMEISKTGSTNECKMTISVKSMDYKAAEIKYSSSSTSIAKDGSTAGIVILDSQWSCIATPVTKTDDKITFLLAFFRKTLTNEDCLRMLKEPDLLKQNQDKLCLVSISIAV